MKRHSLVTALAAAATWPALALGQVPSGSEFHVNTFTPHVQWRAAAACADAGSCVVVWESSGQIGNNTDVFGQRFSPGGTPLGGEFLVNTYTTLGQGFPSVASSGGGAFVVVWQGRGQTGFTYSIFGQRFAADGQRVGSEFRVNTYTGATQYGPRVAVDPAGNFMVVWSGLSPGGNYREVSGQRFSAAGSPVGTEFRVNTYTTDYQLRPSIAADPGGNFIVVWETYQDGDDTNVFGQRFRPSGDPLGGEFRVNTYDADDQAYPEVASDVAGNFAVVWQDTGQDRSGYGVFGQRFSASGRRVGLEFRVNTFTTDAQRNASIASDRDGNFIVTWWSFPQDGSATGIFGQQFGPSGAAVGREFPVNTYTTDYQVHPAVASDLDGNFLIAWQGPRPDEDTQGIFGRSFTSLLPSVLEVDVGGNRVFEPGEVVAVAPSWDNRGPLALSFRGTATSFGGPPGAAYSILDGAADYGTVPGGSRRSCDTAGDCYTLSASAPPERPALHWDARLTETVSVGFARKDWALHLGDSFTDVPRSSPFYRFVETLLHHSVTVGCGGEQYCPAASTTREQMAVFVLVAKEGAGYRPLSCLPPNLFLDVPETSPFCRYVEELARRGVVTGCASNLYCPADSVTREQMAVFVLLTLDPASVPPDCSPPNIFDDVPETSAFCAWIEELARRGVVSGCSASPPLYCPAAAVTREQMGAFLGVAFGLSLYGP